MHLKRTLFMLALCLTSPLADAGRVYYTAHNCSNTAVIFGTQEAQGLSWHVLTPVAPSAQRQLTYWAGTVDFKLLCGAVANTDPNLAGSTGWNTPNATIPHVYCAVNTGDDSGVRPFKISTSSGICN